MICYSHRRLTQAPISEGVVKDEPSQCLQTSGLWGTAWSSVTGSCCHHTDNEASSPPPSLRQLLLALGRAAIPKTPAKIRGDL